MNEREKDRKKTRKPYIYATATIIFVLVFSIALPLKVNIDENRTNPVNIVASTGYLPKIESFENLYNILRLDESSSDSSVNGRFFGDMALAESTQESNSTRQDSSSESKSKDYSETNVQVEGIDEADIVKTDGEYIYYISSTKIVIVDAKNEENLKIVNEIEYKAGEKETFTPQELFINKNKLVLLGLKSIYEENISNEINPMARIYYPTSNMFTVAKVYNIEDKTKTILEREIEIEGSYLTSRMIDDNIFFIANKYIYAYIPYECKLEDINQEEFKPKYIDTIVGNEEKCIAFPDIAYFPGSEEKSYLNIAGFNINDNFPANIGSYLGAGTNVYASETNIYVTNTKYEYKDTNIYGVYNNYDIKTNIYKFKLNDSKIEYDCVGNVPGSPLNQFSMDEKDGYFRIATTNSQNWNTETNTNNLYVLNSNLKMVGKLENLAKGESIYSVRFMGDRAYIVTFVQVDPLFVIDLSTPTNPVVLGELKIPGYSRYLHPYDENHLIGFGDDTEVIGNRVTTTGMKMALFDVTDASNPKELYNVKIGEKGTYSNISYNHKSLLFSKEKNIIAFPITISEDNYKYSFQGAIVYGLDLEKGFTLRGKIAHMQIENGYRDYDYTKEIERIIYIKENLFTLSKGLIKATAIETMETRGTVEIKVDQTIYGIDY